jgi:histidinol phosphatase-like PHP family hydrolase
MLIDMHNHTHISLPDSVLSPEERIETARTRGVNGLWVTEHFKTEIGRAATCFNQTIRSETDLLRCLTAGGCQAVLL